MIEEYKKECFSQPGLCGKRHVYTFAKCKMAGFVRVDASTEDEKRN